VVFVHANAARPPNDFVDGHPPSAVDQMILEGVEGILILSNGDEMYDEIASRFARATGRPVWHNLTDIPR
jgi:hypothetical protein